MSRTQTASGRYMPARPKDALRISFGIFWLIDAILKWLPGFRSGYMDTSWPRPRARRLLP
ncbi:MAG TPA: hypothetical protein VIV12_13090 [Streptosporangiaceae bacterium]